MDTSSSKTKLENFKNKCYEIDSKFDGIRNSSFGKGVKKVWTGTEKVLSNEVICLLLLLGALIYDMYFLLLGNPMKRSLSQYGDTYHAEFIGWCVVTAVSLFFNTVRLYRRVQGEGKLMTKIAWFFLVFAMISIAIVGATPAGNQIHFIFSIIFALVMMFAIAFGLFQPFLRDRNFRIVAITFMIGYLGCIVLVAIYKQMALIETVPVFFGYIILAFTNFTSLCTLPPVAALDANANAASANTNIDKDAEVDKVEKDTNTETEKEADLVAH